MQSLIRANLEAHRRAFEALATVLVGEIEAAARLMLDTLRAGRKIMLCGNGGSAADAQHLAAELTGRYLRERRPWPAISLTTDTSALTAIGNDYGFDAVFARQVEALATPGDLVVGISTSGHSANVLAALDAARQCGCRTLGLTGRDGGAMPNLCDVCLVMPTSDTPRIQELHILVGHMLCDAVEAALCAEATPILRRAA